MRFFSLGGGCLKISLTLFYFIPPNPPIWPIVQWDTGALGLWETEKLEYWDTGTQGHWDIRTRNTGTLGQRNTGIMGGFGVPTFIVLKMTVSISRFQCKKCHNLNSTKTNIIIVEFDMKMILVHPPTTHQPPRTQYRQYFSYYCPDFDQTLRVDFGINSIINNTVKSTTTLRSHLLIAWLLPKTPSPPKSLLCLIFFLGGGVFFIAPL